MAALGAAAMLAWPVLNARWLLSRLQMQSSDAADRARVASIAMSLIVCVGLVIPVWEGGDHFALARFYQPLWPLMFLPMLALVSALPLRLSPRLRTVCGGLFVALCVLGPKVSWANEKYNEDLRVEFDIAREGQQAGLLLNRMFGDEPPSLGVVTAGGIALTYRGAVSDVLGLNNVAMAHAHGDRHGMKGHAAFDADVFMAQRPQLLLPLAMDGITVQQWWDASAWARDLLKGVQDTAPFSSTYELALIAKGDLRMVGYVERGYAAQLARHGYTVTRPR